MTTYVFSTGETELGVRVFPELTSALNVNELVTVAVTPLMMIVNWVVAALSSALLNGEVKHTNLAASDD